MICWPVPFFAPPCPTEPIPERFSHGTARQRRTGREQADGQSGAP
jgi:hypothetical protein